MIWDEFCFLQETCLTGGWRGYALEETSCKSNKSPTTLASPQMFDSTQQKHGAFENLSNCCHTPFWCEWYSRLAAGTSAGLEEEFPWVLIPSSFFQFGRLFLTSHIAIMCLLRKLKNLPPKLCISRLAANTYDTWIKIQYIWLTMI